MISLINKKASLARGSLFFAKDTRRLFAFDVHDFAAFIVAAAWAYGVRKALLATVGAGDGVAGFERVMGAAAVAAAFGCLTFWKGCHISSVPYLVLVKRNIIPEKL